MGEVFAPLNSISSRGPMGGLSYRQSGDSFRPSLPTISGTAGPRERDKPVHL